MRFLFSFSKQRNYEIERIIKEENMIFARTGGSR